MILLERLLNGLEIRVETFALCDLTDGDPLTLPGDRRPTLHYCLSGEGRLRPARGGAIAFRRHSVIILPPNLPARLDASGDGGEDWPRRVSNGQPLTRSFCRRLPAIPAEPGVPAPAAVLACGRIVATYQESTGLFDHLAAPIVDDFASDPKIRRPFEALLAEMAEPLPGSAAMVDAIMQQCLVLLLRRYCESGECRLPWLSALEDPRLGRAIAAMLDSPADDFTLERLAGLAGMSRSAFAARFGAAYGRGPIDFLKELRLRRAAELLRTTDLPVKAVAPKVGYASRSYFSRAFKARYGIDPAGYRRADHGSAVGT